MKFQISNALVSDVLFITGGIITLATSWLAGWQVGGIVTGAFLCVLGVVVRGVDLISGGRRKR